MHFNYDPVFGLQYMSFEDFEVPVIDVSKIPKNFSIDDFKEMFSKQGILLVSSTPEPEYYYPQITCNINFNQSIKL